MAFEHDPSIAEYQHESHRPREAEALHMLRKIASLVKPIMRQRGWRVSVLTEFWPDERNLLGLNVNQGERICLRLRYAGDERQFLPLEQITDTMLHELCHIVHGPHDEAFHNLWNQLREEYDQLRSKGYTGEGFLSQGHKLGGGRIPMHEARRLARASAEKRRELTAGSGQRLGGAPVRRGQDIRKVIADAATRRAEVTKGCASGTSKERERQIIEGTNRNGFRTKAEEDDANEETIMIAYIDLVQEDEKKKYGDAYIPPSKENPAGSQGAPIRIRSDPESSSTPSRKPSAPPIPKDTKPLPSTNPPQDQVVDLTSSTSYNDPWTCEICTLVNPSTYLVCDACSTERPSPSFPASAAQTSYNTTNNGSRSASTPSTQTRPSSIRDSNSTKAIKSLVSLDETMKSQPPRPLGWVCHACGTFMEGQWWTCSACGTMKLSS